MNKSKQNARKFTGNLFSRTFCCKLKEDYFFSEPYSESVAFLQMFRVKKLGEKSIKYFFLIFDISS